jgi:excisionase family DNA binding protein
VREAGAALGVSTATVYKLCATGTLKHIQVGNQIRIDAAASPPRGATAWLSVRQAANALGVSAATVYKLCATGKLRHIRVGNQIRIDPAATIPAPR